MVVRFPKYFISIGKVTTPTIIRVDIKTAICACPAPALSSDVASGSATNPGIKVMEPTTAAIHNPQKPDSAPSS